MAASVMLSALGASLASAATRAGSHAANSATAASARPRRHCSMSAAIDEPGFAWGGRLPVAGGTHTPAMTARITAARMKPGARAGW